MDLEKIANLIKEKRKEKNLTQVELAEKLYVTEKAISRWETGRGCPDVFSKCSWNNCVCNIVWKRR